MTQIDTSILAAFSLLWLAIVPTPGPNSLMVMHLALTRSGGEIAAAVFGNVLGIVALAIAALLGMTALLEAFPWLRLAIHVFGGLYLIWLGARLLQHSWRGDTAARIDAGPTGAVSLRRAFALGLATSLSNAQAVIFITSIFVVTGVLKAGLATGLLAVAIIALLNTSYLGMLGWLFLRAGPRRIYTRFKRWIEALVGGLFVVFGVRLVLRQLS